MKNSKKTHLKRILINVFIVLNIFTVFKSNFPRKIGDGFSIEHYSPGIRRFVLMLNYYAYSTGLDNRWEMFSYMYHYDYWYTIEATLENEPSKRLLLLPLQSERSFMESNFFDFRESKFLATIIFSDFERTRYAKYLCRCPSPEKIESISFTINTQNILDRKSAASKGYHLEPSFSQKLLGQVKC